MDVVEYGLFQNIVHEGVVYLLFFDYRDIGIGILALKDHSPTPDGVSTRFEFALLVFLVSMLDCEGITLGSKGDCWIDHRCRRVIDVREDPEEELSCRLVVPRERGVTRLGSVHKNEREVVCRNVETANGDPIGTLLE